MAQEAAAAGKKKQRQEANKNMKCNNLGKIEKENEARENSFVEQDDTGTGQGVQNMVYNKIHDSKTGESRADRKAEQIGENF